MAARPEAPHFEYQFLDLSLCSIPSQDLDPLGGIDPRFSGDESSIPTFYQKSFSSYDPPATWLSELPITPNLKGLEPVFFEIDNPVANASRT